MIRKSTAAALVVIAFLVGGAIGHFWGYDSGWDKAMEEASRNEQANDNDENVDENSKPNPEDVTFQRSDELGFYGNVTLTGYLETQKRDNVEYAYFVYDNISNAALSQFMEQNQGNSFAEGNKVGIGCKQEDQKRIFYENFGDSGEIQGQITGSDYDRLLESDKDSKVQMRMVRPIYTSGRGAPDCYSHFRNFDVL